ncbi:putative quinol monooxygenase [Phaeovulum sp. W22_SRMD_FR3]|uniref:putative quinol monooxygenase n=1 Tax=Phaeovulum sp. W22_SRMD_FR3 TaxID=3240274 RepID=UPI003F97DC22
MIHVTGRLICANDAQRQIVLAHLPAHIEASRAEPGCLTFNVQPTENPLVWELDESFATAEDFAAHQQRTKASIWGQVSGEIGRDFTFTEA